VRPWMGYKRGKVQRPHVLNARSPEGPASKAGLGVFFGGHLIASNDEVSRLPVLRKVWALGAAGGKCTAHSGRA